MKVGNLPGLPPNHLYFRRKLADCAHILCANASMPSSGFSPACLCWPRFCLRAVAAPSTTIGGLPRNSRHRPMTSRDAGQGVWVSQVTGHKNGTPLPRHKTRRFNLPGPVPRQISQRLVHRHLQLHLSDGHPKARRFFPPACAALGGCQGHGGMDSPQRHRGLEVNGRTDGRKEMAGNRGASRPQENRSAALQPNPNSEVEKSSSFS